jgi:hypothetical protein
MARPEEPVFGRFSSIFLEEDIEGKYVNSSFLSSENIESVDDEVEGVSAEEPVTPWRSLCVVFTLKDIYYIKIVFLNGFCFYK